MIIYANNRFGYYATDDIEEAPDLSKGPASGVGKPSRFSTWDEQLVVQMLAL